MVETKSVPMYKDIELCDGLSPDFLQSFNKFITEWESQSDFITVFTSGSTGKPKSVRLSKDRVIASARATGKFFKFSPGQSVLLNLSPDYIAGKLMIIRAIEHQMKIVVAPVQENPLKSIQTIKTKIDFGAFVPYQLKAILNDSATLKKYATIPNVIIGGAPLSLELEKKLEAIQNETYATFGMTETITHFALRNVSKGEEEYTCLPGFSVRTDDRDCLVIDQNKITDELITNDRVELNGNNRFKWIGRYDHVINSGGVKISPEILEKKVQSVFNHARFYFIGRPSEKFGEEVVLYIEGAKDQKWSEIQELVFSKLDKYSRPKEVLFVEKFEETASGKVKRLLL